MHDLISYLTKVGVVVALGNNRNRSSAWGVRNFALSPPMGGAALALLSL